MYEMLKEFIEPGFVIGIPALYLVGMYLKKTAVPDKYIPLILGCIGVVGCMAWTVATMTAFDWQSVLAERAGGAVQCGGAGRARRRGERVCGSGREAGRERGIRGGAKAPLFFILLYIVAWQNLKIEVIDGIIKPLVQKI